jgi:hypothetical protein
MELPTRALEIIDDLWATHLDLARGDDDQRRALTKIMAEQICFELGPRWGCKKASETRPQSKDAIAFNGPEGLCCWDWQQGTSREPRRPPFFWSAAELIRTNGGKSQVFIPVSPVNHLGASPVPPLPPAPKPPAPPVFEGEPPLVTDMAELLERIDALEQRYTALEDQCARDLETLRQRRYVAKVLGITIVSVPEDSTSR